MGADPTIAAIATARGEAALAIVRLSGSDAFDIADRVFRGSRALADVSSHTVWFGEVVDVEGVLIDQVVATVFRNPRSSTGEDVVEFTCHGGSAAPSGVLDALYAAGAVPAEPGGFTKRAFLNGKLDLDQAEAVIEVIHSRSLSAHRAATRQLQGRLKERLSILRSELLRVCGLVELELDFGEEDLEFANRSQVRGLLSDAARLLDTLITQASAADKIRDGISLVIAGRPNAGKSTLLNALSGTDRVIVSDQPGTTRDVVEVDLEVDGLWLRVSDTAGLRSTGDEIEAEGVRRTEALIDTADVLVYVYDILERLSAPEIESLLAGKRRNGGQNVVLVANKADLLTADFGADFRPFVADTVSDDLRVAISRFPHVSISATQARATQETLEALLEEIRRVIPASVRDFESSDGMINDRHTRHLRDAAASVRRASELLDSGSGGELVSMELRTALEALGYITGEITNEDVLSEIFSKFCIGK